MIGRLRGPVLEKQLDGACIVDVGGVGYEVFVPLGTAGRLPAPPEAVTFHVHTHVREDALLLYGFASAADREAFRTLLTISSVGPKLAMAILGAMDAAQLASAIASQDPKRFKGIPGVGKRIVERLLLELRDKLGFVSAGPVPLSLGGSPASRAPTQAGPLSVVASILVSMGFKTQEADRAVALIAGDAGDETVETLVKRALAHLG